LAAFLFKLTINIMDKIKPIILKGTREYLPEEMAKRNLVMAKICKVFERFGYDSIETPIINPTQTILGKYGEEGDKLTYNFKDNGNRDICLPYDLTVPFARLVAANWPQLPMPFKRYQIQKVWRADKPQKGRQREFYQCDIDIIGSKSLLCEAEVAKVINSLFSELGFEKFVIKLNSRRLLNDIMNKFEIKDAKASIQIIDKLSKVGKKVVIEMLVKIGVEKAEELMSLLEPDATNKETFEKFADFDTGELEEFFDWCENMGIPSERLQFDPSLARGLDYYTGISFEVFSEEAPFGALCAGGRYDDLCSMFCNKDFSGVGVAFGFARIMLGLESMGKLNNVKLSSKVLVTIFDDKSINDSLSVYNDLIESGVNSEMYFEAAKLAKQFKYADKKNIPFVIIIGDEEKAKDEVTIKNMVSGKQKTIARKQLCSYLNNYTNV